MPIKHLKPRSSRTYGQINNTPSKKNRRHKLSFLKNKKFLKKLFLTGLALGILGFIFGTIVVVWVSKDLPDPDKINDRQIAESTKIYDRTGEQLLYEIYQEQKRTLVELDEIAPSAINATIAIEDKHFYEHGGIRPLSILRAAFNNILGRSSGGGGASTMTQQLIKKTIVGDEHSYFRKIKEAILAIRLEKKYTKDQILKLYLNEIPYGSTNYGIESASQSYFGKKAIDLEIHESATLAALIQAPTRYLNDLKTLEGRRNTVIGLMANQGYITEEEKEKEITQELKINKSSGILEASHFVLYVKQLLAEMFGEKTVDAGGLKVITTLDYEKQRIAESAVKELGDKFAEENDANNAALVALDPKTGQILSLVGSRDFQNDEIDGQFNVAILGRRQPGSSFKPFVYASAFEKGYTPDTVLYDVLTDFEKRAGGSYIPENYDGKEHGLLTIRKALQGSLNIPAVKALYLVGVPEVIEFAGRFGYTTLNENAGLSLVLGGSEVSLLEHTNGYATLANNGRNNKTTSILNVENSAGDNLYEWKETRGEEAVTPEIAALTTSILSDDAARTYAFGANGILTLPGRPVAAKTGTTNDYKDAWTLGYTPSLVAGVWVGNTTPSTMKGGGGRLAGQIWNRFMKESLEGKLVEEFPDPPTKDAAKPVLRGNDGGITLNINKMTGLIASSSTPERLIIEKTYLTPHTILHYVNKDDPRGETPANPSEDSQYASWEEALQDWVMREKEAGNEISFEEPPTQVDEPGSIELLPNITIISPVASSTLTDRNINIEVEATAKRGVSRVVYNIDGRNIGVGNNYPFNINYYALKLTPGWHTLSALAEDDLGNSQETEINFNLDIELDNPFVSWTDNNTTVQKQFFPRAFLLNVFRWEDISQVKIVYEKDGGPKTLLKIISGDTELKNGKLEFIWNTAPEQTGRYTLTAISTTKDDGDKEDSVMVVVE